MNQRRIEEIVERARKFGIQGAEPHLIQPRTTVKQYLKRGEPAYEERLPSATCIAVLDSNELAREDSEPYSSLTVVWFQEQFALPIAIDVEEAIKTIDREVRAKDWCW